MSHNSSIATGSTTSTAQQGSFAHGDGKAASQTSRQKVKVEITSDAICPFCILGLRYLQKAIADAHSSDPSSPLAHLDFEIEFKPFQLDPTLTNDVLDKRKRAEKKFGKIQFGKFEAMLKQKAKDVGVNFSYDGPVSSTHDYHRVMYAAYAKGGQDLQLPLAERLFSGYFEHQQNPGSRAWLAKEAVATGVFPSIEEANKFFESNQYDAEVKQGYLQAHKMGITGVPFFVFDGKLGVSGAQPPEAFLEVFQELAAKDDKNVGVVDGAAGDEGAMRCG